MANHKKWPLLKDFLDQSPVGKVLGQEPENGRVILLYNGSTKHVLLVVTIDEKLDFLTAALIYADKVDTALLPEAYKLVNAFNYTKLTVGCVTIDPRDGELTVKVAVDYGKINTDSDFKTLLNSVVSHCIRAFQEAAPTCESLLPGGAQAHKSKGGCVLS